MTGAALTSGFVADLVFGDPRTRHPVAGFGALAARAEAAAYAPSRARGAAYAVLLVGCAGATGALAGRRRSPLVLAVATWAALGGRSLTRVATRLAQQVEAGDLAGARATLPSLCGRDPQHLDGPALTRAALESVAENTADAVVGVLLWGALAGPGGVLAYRAANTLDAMVGHRSPRYAEFGWAAARLDDVLNWPVARLAAALTVACAPVVGGSPRVTARIARSDGAAHPSPNAGRVEAAFAGALGVRLGGPLAYDGVAELRPAMGDGRAPTVADVRRATRLSLAVGVAATAACALRPDKAPTMKGALLVAGTHSDAGKSLVTAGLCRWLAREGVRVAPFKAQNMALNSVVARGGFEIGRAQAMQAAAARVEPEVAMNPILIKPSGQRHSQVVVMGKPYADVSARSYQGMKDELRPVVAAALADLRARFDVVVCEGAGSPAEINLRAADLTNMGLARAADLPVVLVGDIDRGGVFASLLGTLVALAPEDQRHVAGFIINKFRGDEAILAPGLTQLEALTGRPTLGVLPFVEDLTLDAEDSLGVRTSRHDRAGAIGLDVAVVRLRWMSNFTDVDALACEPGVRVRFTRSAVDIARADLVVVPGTKATVEDLERLCADGLDTALAARAAAGGPILGLCGGYQLLGERIVDTVESGAGEVTAVSLLPVVTTFAGEKILRTVAGRSALLRSPVGGYEIRHGRPAVQGGAPLIVDADGNPEGCVEGATLGTSWHGLLEHDDARRALLRWVAARRGLDFAPAPAVCFADERERQLDAAGDLVARHLDTERVRALIDRGVPTDMPDLLLERAPVLRFITTADTEILATAAAVRRLPGDFPEVRCANPQGTRDLDPFLDEVLDGARVVVIRVLGGRRGWQGGVDRLAERCRAAGIALIALGGEARPDAEMTALSTVPAGAVAQAGEYLQAGNVDNIEQLLRFLADTFLLHGFGFDPPTTVAEHGVYLPGRGDVTLEEALADRDAGAPVVGITFYRAHRLTGNTAFVDALCAAVARAGGHPVPVWSATLRRSHGEGRVPAFELLQGHIDALITTMLATGGSHRGDATGEVDAADGGTDEQMAWDARALEALDVPVVQALCVTMSRARWEEGGEGLLPVDAATQVAIPEFDGRIIGGPICFKERDADDSPIGVPVPRYVADEERCDRLATLVLRHARLRDEGLRRRIAIVLTAFPTKHARIGMAVGLDTPASAIGLLHRLREDGVDVRDIPADGDALMHALIAGGGHDPELLTEDLLAAAPLRLAVADYRDWYATLDANLRAAMEERWGPPPGDRYRDGDDLVIAGLELGDVVVLIQPPRGYGDDQVGIYHDPELAPAHHYLAAYRWLDHHWGADAIVHLGKHGTLEWLPGKMLALSAACAPDVALGSMPLVYPFVVNDPGEGAQAKRRAHAVVVDHLVPPMMRAESYDELADLEALMDEYARLEVLDPAKLPGLGVQIWAAIERANLQEDLGIADQPGDAGELVEHLDGYLCEIKDVQIKDGLHVLGVVPDGPQLRGLVAAIGRHGSGDVPGLRRAVGTAFGLDEPALVATPGARVAAGSSAGLIARFPGTAHRGSDLLDRLEEAQHALLTALSEHDWDPARAATVCASVLGFEDPGVVAALRFAGGQIVGRLRRTTDELDHVLAALRGRHVPAGPSGAPTRGRFDVLPTGRNFYTVDPRALPSELSYKTGAGLADAVLERHVADTGALPEMVGLVAWGTAAMRTQGDDAAEVLALLGVRPTWHASSRRVTGLEVVSLAELGRPRIDVTLRISGFFRDAFPHLIGLLDDAVTLVAGLDESDDDNYVAKHARARAAALAGELDAAEAWRRATTRIFGSKPGTYGAGLSELLETQDWRDDRDLAAVYEAWSGFAYGRGLDGVGAAAAMRDCFAQIEVAVKNVDSREHDHLDSDDYYQYHGGMVATVAALRGSAPAAYLGDSSDPETVRTRTLAEETRRIFRARVANPAWIGSMVRHGFKGAAELSATVDYLFGYDATTDVASDWMYEQVAARYLLDEDIAAFMDQANPWAARGIAERLLEAADRGMWREPAAETLEQIKARYLALEDRLEGATA